LLVVPVSRPVKPIGSISQEWSAWLSRCIQFLRAIHGPDLLEMSFISANAPAQSAVAEISRLHRSLSGDIALDQ
jgi:hypothetical protein